MADYKHFRVIVDLSAFFCDHRRVARIFVKKNLKSIADLQTRISEIFEISEFYLTTGGHFLPALEDIRILSNNECVSVIPNKPQEITEQSILKVTSSTQQKKHKKHKKPLEPIPEDSRETLTPRKKKSKKKRVDFPILPSSSSEDEVPRKKKKSENNESIVTDQTCSTENNQKKVKENGKSADCKPFDSCYENGVLQNKEQNESIVEREICNIESLQKIIDIKKKLKQKADEYINKHSKETSCNFVNASTNIKNVLPKLQSHIKNCNDLGRSNVPDIVRLSRHADTPIKSFTQYTPPPRITDKYLAKNKINIVKIDVVKEGGVDSIEQANVSQSSASSDNAAEASNKNLENFNSSPNSGESYSPPKNYVKEVISTFEKNISPESKKDIGEQNINEIKDIGLGVKDNEASNYTKAFLDQREPNSLDNFECKTDIPESCGKNLLDIAPAPNTILNGLEDQSILFLKTEDLPTTKILNDKLESTNVSLDLSSIVQDASYLSGNTKDSILDSSSISLNLNNSSVRSKHSNKIFGGVGSLLENLRESDSVISHESDASTNVTKRKRIRKHRKKNKKSDECLKPASVTVETYVIKPVNVKACPSIHIKFEDNEMETLEEKPLNINDSNDQTNAENCTENKIEKPQLVDKPQVTLEKNENKSLLVETMVLSDESDDPIMENKSIFGEESISKAPLMTNKLEPKVGDVIAFKVIKLTEDYTPQVSSYIVGKLLEILDNKTVYVKILNGAEELLPPTGKLSLNEDTDMQNSKYQEFLWTDLITPKLLYP